MKSFGDFLTESSLPTVALYHGGRGLKYNYRETIAHKKGNWEYGPGLYLTTHYDTARKYAKGGGQVYKVTVEQGNDIRKVDIPYAAIEEFARVIIIGTKRKETLDRIQKYRHDDKVNADIFLNNIINGHAIPNNKSGALKDFLAEQGVDYVVQTRYSGRDETIMVVVDSDKIQKVEVVSPNTKEFELPFEFI